MLEIHMDDIHGVCHSVEVFEKVKAELSEHLLVKPQGPFGAGDEFLHLKRLHKVGKDTVDLEPNR
eukprot:825670-Amphidinium_carterae.1